MPFGAIPKSPPMKRDEIAARACWRLKEHYSGKLRMSDVKEMFQRMREEDR
jgi:hypothetical protein